MKLLLKTIGALVCAASLPAQDVVFRGRIVQDSSMRPVHNAVVEMLPMREPDAADRRRGAPARRCYVDVYLDGVAVYGGPVGSLFDVNSISPNSIEGIEFYAGP
jgi:hypothetical protein